MFVTQRLRGAGRAVVPGMAYRPTPGTGPSPGTNGISALIGAVSRGAPSTLAYEDATAAVESLTVDWNAQAAKAAEGYLDFSSFSCQGLIDQLASEYGDQYTVDQATHGAKQTGIC